MHRSTTSSSSSLSLLLSTTTIITRAPYSPLRARNSISPLPPRLASSTSHSYSTPTPTPTPSKPIASSSSAQCKPTRPPGTHSRPSGTHPRQDTDIQQDISAISAALYIRQASDWYSIPKSHLRLVVGLSGAVRPFRDMEALARVAFPDHAWDSALFTRTGRFAPQAMLLRMVRHLFAHEGNKGQGGGNANEVRILYNERKEHGIRGQSGAGLEIDILLPDLKLGFEYQVRPY